MDKNDEKITSREDETLPTDDDEQMSLAAAPEPAETLEDRPADIADTEEPAPPIAKTIAFPGPKVSAARLEPNFGMPDLDFFSAARSDGGSDAANEAEAPRPEPALEMAPVALMPLKEGTGWESGETINKPSSLRARIEMHGAESGFDEPLFANDDDLPDDDDLPGPEPKPRHDANVTPFPGTALNRSFEPSPAELMRGGGTSASVFGEISARAAEDQSGAPFDAAGASDTLADAVQSALRNVYGGYAEPQDEANDLGGYTVADALGAAPDPSVDPSWADDRGVVSEWSEAQMDDHDEEGVRRDAAESSTDAVLDYLYRQRRPDNGAFGAEPSLADFAQNSAAGDWRDEDDEHSQPRVTPFPTRERVDPYRGRELQPAASAEPARFFQDEPLRPSLGDQWAEAPYPTPQNARGSITPTYAPAIATPADQLTTQGPDSGHLLGAAGLGLIGGIALAGVLAVFVFNSFVDESGQAISEQGAKVVERLAPAQATSPVETRSTTPAPEIRVQTPPPAQTPPAASAEPPRPAPAAAPEPQRSAALPPAEPARRPAPARPALTASAVTGSPDTPIRLAIAVSDANLGDALVSLKGLPKDAKLSTGIDVGGGQWLLPPSRLKDLTVTAPAGTAGSYQLEVQLLKDDAQTSMSDPVPFNLSIASPPPPPAPATRPAPAQPTPGAAPNPQRVDNSRLAALPDEAPQPDTDFLTQMLIRDGNKKMREGDIAAARRFYEQAVASGHPEAALAMGRSYDPTYFEKLNVKTGKPDPATAFEWYKKALDGGLVTARVKIDALKQWLQR